MPTEWQRNEKNGDSGTAAESDRLKWNMHHPAAEGDLVDPVFSDRERFKF